MRAGSRINDAIKYLDRKQIFSGDVMPRQTLDRKIQRLQDEVL
jgi:hypothetical protein